MEKFSGYVWIDFEREIWDENIGLVIFYMGVLLKVMKLLGERDKKGKFRSEIWGTLIFRRENKEKG